MSLDEAPSLAPASVSGTGILILGTEFTEDIVILANGLPTLLVFVNVADDLDLSTLLLGYSSESVAESESLLVDADRFRLLIDLSDGFVNDLVLVVFVGLLLKRRGVGGFEWGTAELESLSLWEQAEQQDVLVELEMSSGCFFLTKAGALGFEMAAGGKDLELDFVASVVVVEGGAEEEDADMANFMRRPPVSDLKVKFWVIKDDLKNQIKKMYLLFDTKLQSIRLFFLVLSGFT